MRECSIRRSDTETYLDICKGQLVSCEVMHVVLCVPRVDVLCIPLVLGQWPGGIAIDDLAVILACKVVSLLWWLFTCKPVPVTWTAFARCTS